MARKKITDLLGEELTESQSTMASESGVGIATLEPKAKVKPLGTESVSTKLTELQSFASVENGAKSSAIEQGRENQELESTQLTDSRSNRVPKYLSLERKEVRLPSEHIDELTRIVRRLNRQKRGKDERITENTLIRIAVALLVEAGDEISGNNEQELLQSCRERLGKLLNH